MPQTAVLTSFKELVTVFPDTVLTGRLGGGEQMTLSVSSPAWQYCRQYWVSGPHYDHLGPEHPLDTLRVNLRIMGRKEQR